MSTIPVPPPPPTRGGRDVSASPGRGGPGGEARPDLSIVVVTYNSRGVVERCLESVRAAAAGLDTEVIVVDNASVDGSADLVAERFPGVRLIRNRDNLGFGRANNRGFELARGRYMLLLNPDTLVAPDALGKLIEFADAHPRAGAVGARLEYPDGRLQHSAFRFPDLCQAVFGFFDVVPLDSRVNGRYGVGAYAGPFATEHLIGACLLLRREALDSVGPFDPRYFMYFEETDLCVRLRRAGWQNLFTPDARVVHLGATSTSVVHERMSVEFHRSQAYFYGKHYGRAGYLALKAIVWAGIGYRLARSARAYLRGRISRRLLLERLGGYWEILWF